MKITSTFFRFAAFAAMIGGAAASNACTSWVIHPSRSANGRMIVHKCRDSQYTPLDAKMVELPNGSRFMRIGTVEGWNCFVMNDRGVVAILNAADPVSSRHPGGDRVGYGGGGFLTYAATHCAKADQLWPFIKFCAESSIALGPQSFFVADAKRAFLIDVVGPDYAACKEIYGGIAIISNCMHLPGMEKYSRQRWPNLRYDRRREANVRRELKKGKVNGKYTIADTMRISRLKWERDPQKHLPFRKDSLGGTTFDIDPEFPGFLSTAYIALGPQQHTVYLPTPMALRQFPEAMGNGSWGELAMTLRKALGDDHAGLAKIVELEKQLFAEYETTREQARKLLREQRPDEAVKLLNDCYQRQFSTAEKLLTQLLDAAASNGGDAAISK
jgi:DnaJ-domain-containing protein 1